MTTATDNQAFVDSLIGDVIQPGVDDLMDSRYFRDLRGGKLTTRRMQGFSIQHYIHNMAVLKMAALGATQHASDDRAFMAFGQLLNDEFTHPAMVKRFGLSLGLTEEDFDRAKPVYGPMIHTAVCLAQIFLVSVVEMRAMALSNETMVQRYATEFDEYLAKEPYNMDRKQRQFFIVHGGADIEHTARGAAAIVELAPDDESRQNLVNMCRHMAVLKLGKFESIYDEYA